MARRHRTRSRTRRDAVAARRTPAPVRAEHEAPPVARATHRPMRAARGGFARAAGAPSAALERAAVIERGFVTKDFRRVGIVVAITIVLLVVAGIVEGALVR